MTYRATNAFLVGVVFHPPSTRVRPNSTRLYIKQTSLEIKEELIQTRQMEVFKSRNYLVVRVQTRRSRYLNGEFKGVAIPNPFEFRFLPTIMVSQGSRLLAYSLDVDSNKKAYFPLESFTRFMPSLIFLTLYWSLNFINSPIFRNVGTVDIYNDTIDANTYIHCTIVT